MKEGNRKPRVAIDTNLVISGTISPQGLASNLLTSWTHDAFAWIVTEETFRELQEVLGREKIKTKYHIDEADTNAFLDNLAVGAEFVKAIPHNELPVHSRDCKDDIMLACALAGGCDYLITGDEDLLVLNGRPELGSLEIITVAQFLQRKQ
jgi:uncharacterized protein